MVTSSKSYLIYSFNSWIIVLTATIGMILPFIVLQTFMMDYSFYTIILVFITFWIPAHIATKSLGLRPIRVQFDTDHIEFSYLSLDLKTVKRQKLISIKKIRAYSDSAFNGHQVFKLTFLHGTTFSIYKHLIWYKNDDFETLSFDFKNFIMSSKTLDTPSEQITNHREIEYIDFFQSHTAKVLFYIAIGLFILTSFITVSGHIDNLGTAIMAIAWLMGYILTYLAKRSDSIE